MEVIVLCNAESARFLGRAVGWPDWGSGLGQIRYMGGIGLGGSGRVVRAAEPKGKTKFAPPFLRRKDASTPQFGQ